MGGILFAGTILTVAMYYVHIPSVAATIAIALLIATVKAAFVAGVFMHLSDERKMIYSILLCTVCFLISLMGLTLWAMNDFPFFWMRSHCSFADSSSNFGEVADQSIHSW